MMKLFAFIGLFVSLSANATVIYSYSGNNFTDISGGLPDFSTDDYVTAILRFDDALLPNQFNVDPSTLSGFGLTLNAGSVTYEYGQTGVSVSSSVATDSNGGISEWYFTLLNGDPLSVITTCSNFGCDWGNDWGIDDGISYCCVYDAGNTNNPGVWTVQTVPEVPIPATTWLIGSALLGLGAARRKKA